MMVKLYGREITKNDYIFKDYIKTPLEFDLRLQELIREKLNLYYLFDDFLPKRKEEEYDTEI